MFQDKRVTSKGISDAIGMHLVISLDRARVYIPVQLCPMDSRKWDITIVLGVLEKSATHNWKL